MRLFNTATHEKEIFHSIDSNEVMMYLCGPTVYDYIHIGNARPFIIFDTLRRYLEYIGYTVKYIQNITDIDDKIIASAIDKSLSFNDVSEKYAQAFLEDISNLNIRNANIFPRVSEEIPGIILMIRELVCRGFAYESSGSVYFSSYKVEGYGKLSAQPLEDMEHGSRVLQNPEKRHPADFALWKGAKPGEPAWPSIWGLGRPAWHIECSFMARKYLSTNIDIHAGGEDLIFPHHENERAQSAACHCGQEIANFWLHNAMLLFDSQKMSKSKGNFSTVRELAQDFPYEVMRFSILSAHYRSPLNFSEEALLSAKAGLERIENCYKRVQSFSNDDISYSNIPSTVGVFFSEFEKALRDDLNTANAITALFDLVKFTNKTQDSNLFPYIYHSLNSMLEILGIKFSETTSMFDESTIEGLIQERSRAKAAKDFTKADEIRNKLETMGISINDTKGGTTWNYVR